MKTRSLPLSTALLLMSAATLCAQDPLVTINVTDGFTPGQVQQGKPLGSYSLSSFESVNLGNGQLNLFLPLATVHGRGNVSIPLGVNVTGQSWNVEDDAYDPDTCDVGAHGKACTAVWQYSLSSAGWNSAPDYGGGTFLFRSSGDYCTTSTSGSTYWHLALTRGTFVTPDGTETEFIDQTTNPGGSALSGTTGHNRGNVFISDNGTFMQFTASANVIDPTNCLSTTFGPTGTMVTKDGTTYTITNGIVRTIRDRNGNLTNFDPGSVTDSLERTYTYSPGSSIGYPGLGNVQRAITIVSGSLSDSGVLTSGESLQTGPQLWSGVSNQTDTTSTFNPNNLIKEIDLPDGTSYKFTYHAYGDVAQVTLPTGAYIQYDYASKVVSTNSVKAGNVLSGGFSITIPVAPVYALTRSLTERRVFDSGGKLVSKMDFPSAGEIDTYDGATGGLLAKEVHAISSSSADVSSGINYNSVQLGQTSSITSYDTDGASVLQTQSFIYTQQNCDVSCQTVQQVTTTMNGDIRYTTYGFDNYNNINDEKDYDWLAGAPNGSLLREVKTTYNTSSSYTGSYLLNLVSEVQVFDGSGTRFQDTTYTYDEYNTNPQTPLYNCGNIIGHDNANFAGGGFRGNPTTVSTWLNLPTPQWLSTYQAYDIAGNIRSIQDANGHTTSFDYTDSYSDGANRNSYGFVTTAVNANKQATYAQYDYGLGQQTILTDLNNHQTTFSYGATVGSASVDKLGTTTYADGSHSYLSYPSILETDAQRDQASTMDGAIEVKTILDSLGRVTETDASGSSTGGQIVTNQYYDGLNRVTTAYNPYDSLAFVLGQDPDQPGYATDPATTYTYDGLGRVKSVTTADNAITTTTYSGNQTTVTEPKSSDPADTDPQVSKTMTYDGLGRLTGLADAALNTTYGYDGNSNMNMVMQGAQTRTFTYDSLSRLTKAVNPESGTVIYTYDNAGNLYQRTDNRKTVTTNTYDALNRIKTTTYSDGTPGVTYSYDSGTNANGQLTSVATNGISTTSYSSFDVMGRFHASTQVTGAGTYPFTYDYNYAGGLKTETYPSGRSVTFGFDTANRQTSVNGTMNGQNTQYINSAGYAPNGGLIGYFLNNGQLTLSTLYNMHQQVSHLAVAYNNNYKNQNYFYQTMDWGTSGNNGVRLSGKKEYISNNGPLPSTPTFSQTFGYDGVNRLTTASETGGWAQTYGYDQYGNMWMPTNGLTSTNQSVPSSNVYNGNNQNPNFSYDAAGNQTTFGSLTLSYDAENRQSKMVDMGGGTGTFQYDGLGHRVVKVLPSLTTTYVYDAFGQMAAEYYSGTALPVPPCSTCYLTHDYLGSVRLVTDAGANVVARHDFAPFGQEIPTGTNGRGSAWGLTSDVDAKFTGQVRDQESGLDFFNARYFAATLGRFNSPDPGSAGAGLMNSQSWNGYAYAVNNPLRFVDPSGRNCIYVGPKDGDLNDPNNYVDDENGGETCAQTFDPTDNNTVSATAYDSLSGLPVTGQATVGSGPNAGNPAKTGTNESPITGVPTNPCMSAGNAPNPGWYASKGQTSLNEMLSGDGDNAGGLLLDRYLSLLSFRRGGSLDAQPLGASRAYGNYVYGAYLAAAGFSLSTTLSGANAFAFVSRANYPGFKMDQYYRSVPAANIANIINGYNAQRNGTLCHK